MPQNPRNSPCDAAPSLREKLVIQVEVYAIEVCEVSTAHSVIVRYDHGEETDFTFVLTLRTVVAVDASGPILVLNVIPEIRVVASELNEGVQGFSRFVIIARSRRLENRLILWPDRLACP